MREYGKHQGEIIERMRAELARLRNILAERA
jgi:hypothetical protein